MKTYSIAVLLLINCTIISSQDEYVRLNNSSFEDIPHKGSPNDSGIRGWFDCGGLQFSNETPPDIHPINAWEVNTPPSEGKTYLGLVVRDNDSWESVSQRIRTPLEKDKCYEFSIDLARSEYYVSMSRITGKVENYTEPTVLRVWGGTGICGHQVLLAQSTVVKNNTWQNFSFRFEPDRDVNHITIEAFYKVPVLFPYNGHLLVDNASDIVEIPCDEELLAVQKTDLPTPKRTSTRTKETSPPKTTTVTSRVPKKQVEKKEKLLAELNNKVQKGQRINVKSLYFLADKWDIQKGSFDVLDEIFDFMNTYKNIVIEIGGHTNTIPPPRRCDELSTRRAKQVADYLIDKGISENRVRFKGYGKRFPLFPDDKHDMEARAKNQRVEIKILSITYKDSTG